jgi:hypothetical protein
LDFSNFQVFIASNSVKMMMITTIVSWLIEGDEASTTMPPAIILNKPPNEITLGDIKRYYHGPEGAFMFKTLEEEEAFEPTQDERYHWTVITDDASTVPVCSSGGIIIKIRPTNKTQTVVGYPPTHYNIVAPELSMDTPKTKKRNLSYEDLTDFTDVPGSPKKKDGPQLVYTCTYSHCGKNFNKPWRLKSHMRNHTGEKKPHACIVDGCGKSFNESQALKNHLRVHTGEKPFVCSVDGCGKRFSEKGNLRKHLRIHTGERPYVCTYDGCEKSFGRSDQLKVHIYEHTGIKPFACGFEGCDKTFSYSSGLKVHQRIHTEPKGSII